VARALGCAVEGLPDDEVLDMLLAAVKTLRAEVGLNRNLGELGVTRAEIPRLAELAMQDPCILTNPRKPAQADIEAIYEAAL
jgi:alcohol dehydrogenase